VQFGGETPCGLSADAPIDTLPAESTTIVVGRATTP